MDTLRPPHGELRIFPTPDDLYQAAAEDFTQRANAAIAKKGLFTVVLSGGQTPKAFFAELASDHFRPLVPWKKVFFFFGDERYVPADSPESNYHMAYENLFSKIPIPTENIYRMPTEYADPNEAAQVYEKTLRQFFHVPEDELPSFDLTYLGIGDNAHTASLMPSTDIVKKYAGNPFDLDAQLVAALWVEELKMYRITLTPPALNHSSFIIYLVTDSNKASALQKILEEPYDPVLYPAQLIHPMKGKLFWYLTKAAASKLKKALHQRVTGKHKPPFTLAIDIGGTGIKMMVIDAKGKPTTAYIRELTPRPATYEAVCEVIKRMIASLNAKIDRTSAGFPGVVLHGVIKTAPNMHPSWIGTNFQKTLEELTGHSARVINDADMQGYGDISGSGVELVITLGTGFGTALFTDGQLVPNLEIAHHPFIDNLTYEELLGKAALEKNGIDQWSEYLKQAIALLDQTFNFDTLYIGGGYSRIINFKLPEKIHLSENIEGVLGGIKLWEV